MIDIFIRLGIAAAAAWGANKAVVHFTDRTILDHVGNWWDSIAHDISGWVGNNQHRMTGRIVGVIASRIDVAMMTARKMLTLRIEGETENDGNITIRETRLTADEIARKFPGFQHSNTVEIQAAY